MEPTGVERKLAAILCADVKDYSRLMGEDEEATLRTLTSHREIIETLVAEQHGRVVSTAGDSLLAEFASAVDAVRSAVEIQERLKEKNAALPQKRRLEFRIGINLGDVMVHGDDIYGDGVNIAARVETLAEPGGICISRGVHDQVKGKLPLSCEDLGPHRVKNIAEPVHTFRVRVAAQEQQEAPTLPDRPSIAVLPFDNMSGDPAQEYFVDGITEDLIADLSKISGLFVIARHSAFTYKGRAVKVQEVGRELGVRYVLEGSVRKADNRVRITAQLVEAGTGGHLWAERYDRDLEDIFAVQDEVAHKIVGALEVKLVKGERERGSRKDTDNLEAYDCMLRGNEQFFRLTQEGVAQARAMFQRAIELDPDYASAYAWLARAHVYDWIVGWNFSFEQTVERGFELAQKAVALDDTLPYGHSMLGWAHLWKKQHEPAIAEGERAVALDPNDADAHAWLAMSLSWAGRPEEAMRLIAKAMRHNPHYPVVYLFIVGHAYFVMERYEESIAALRRSVVRNPDFLPGHLFLGAVCGLLGREEEGRAAVAEIAGISPNYPRGRSLSVFKDPRYDERFREGLSRVGFR
jgi:adenylate cyclase